MNLFALISAEAARLQDRPFLLTPGGGCTWTYADLLARVDVMAAALAARGVRADERVLVQVDKSPDNVALYLAVLKLGAVYVPINTGYTEQEVAYFLADAEPRVFVARTDHAPPRSGTEILTLTTDGGGSLLSGPAETPVVETVPRKPQDLAAILYTSGTTGRSKGAMLTHANLASNAQTLIDYWGWQDDDVLLHALPIFHVHGLFVALHCVLLTGTAMVFLPSFDAQTVAKELTRATVLMGVPTFYTRLLALEGFGRPDVTAVRLFISGSAPLTTQTFEAFEARTGQRILERYGMSETLMNTSNPLNGERVAGTVGFALPGVAVRICDDEGRELPAGETGGIEVRGPNVFAGYWRMPEKTAQEFRPDGFFVTGDLGFRDADGRVTIVGRAKDLVISGGYNVYPKEVETVLDELPGVTESAVIGVPHPDFGEAVVAVVVPTGPAVEEAAVTAALAERLARFKQPKRVMNVDTLPRNAMGKVQKNELRLRFATLFDGD